MTYTVPSYRSIHGKDLGLTPRGLEVYGRPLIPSGMMPDTGGNVYYVQSTHASASDGNDGLSTARPLATLAGAFDKVTANQGDVIVLLPAHNEILGTGALLLDIAGVYVLGLGTGDDMPQFNFNHTAAEISATANGVTLDGIRFSADVTTVAKAIDIEDGVDYTTIRNCIFDVVTTGTDEFTVSIRMVNDNTGTLIEGNYFSQGLAAAVAAVHMDADTDNTQIIGNRVEGDYSTACIVGDTTLSTKLFIKGNDLMNGIPSDVGTEPVIELLTGTEGIIEDNTMVCNLVTPDLAIVADTCFRARNIYIENLALEVGDGDAVPATDSSANFLSKDVIGSKADAAATGAVTATDSLVGYIKQIVTENEVPTANSTDDVNMRDVIGKKADAAAPVVGTTKSLMGLLKGLANSTTRTVEKTDGAVLNATADPLFTVTGGPIRVISLIGVVTTVLVGAANGTLQATTTEPAATTALSTTVAIDNDAAGTVYTFLGPTGILTPTTNGASILDMGHATLAPSMWIVPVGDINFLGSAAATGVIKWYMTYEPLSPSAVVAAAA